MRKVIFYGDSNTYGYDPRGYYGDRYPLASIWTTRVAEALGSEWQVENRGMNGRQIPYGNIGYEYVKTLLKGLKPTDIFAVMLGTNDIQLTDRPDAGAAVIKMDMFLEWLTKRHPAKNVLLIAPVLPGREGENDPLFALFRKETAKMNEGFKALAQQYGTRFADASEWGIELAYDLDHFTEEGHRVFSEKMVFLFLSFS